MADTITLNSGSGGATLATDDIGGVHYQRVKIGQGADGSATDVSSAAPLQVSLANHAANSTAVKVDGSAVTQPVSLTSTTVTGSVAVTHAALTELGDAINGSVLDVNIAAGSVAVTNAGLTELAAAINASSQMDVNVAAGTVAVTNAGLAELAGAINASAQMDVNLAASAATVAISHAALTELAAAINSNLVDVNIVSGSSAGTQYTEADADATIVGTAVLWEDTSDTLRAVSAAKPLPVNVVAGGTSGTQYDEAATDSTITGTAILWEDTADTLRVPSAAKPLPVALISGGLTPTKAATATLANVSGSASSVTLQASNSSRLRLDVMNDSTAILYVKYGSTASATSFTRKLEAGETLVEDLYTGIVTGIWASATGSARMTELTT